MDYYESVGRLEVVEAAVMRIGPASMDFNQVLSEVIIRYTSKAFRLGSTKPFNASYNIILSKLQLCIYKVHV